MKIKALFLTLILSLGLSYISFSQANKVIQTRFTVKPDLDGLRSDTIDISHYIVNLSVQDFITDTLRGNTIIRFTPKKNNIHTISFDLLKFHIDSIRIKNTYPSYSYNDTLLIILLPSVMNHGETSTVSIYYHGKPQLDPSGWGGFYFIGSYAFNLGVGFTVEPHNFGRAWYPCFDNFKTRATYDFNITTSKENTSYCNGELTHDSIDLIHNSRIRSWHLSHCIPSYEASVNVAPYVQLNDTYYGSDTIPIVIAALPKDTSNIRKSFIHLKNAISIFQTCYGKYRWNKIGYSMVPFAGGAMEHPTNIAFPLSCANGTLDYEAEVMAHELSHHWFGDQVTCSRAEDMWLNEGFATFNQFLFTEKLYGEKEYHSLVRANHENVLHYCHIAEHGYWPISGVPQKYTYGDLNFWASTSYEKGADVIYTLRNYMGDSAFFNGIKYYLNTHLFQSVNSDTLKKSLERSSGMNLTDFFSQWVYSPGFPHFSIDSSSVKPEGSNYKVKIYVKQKLTGTKSYYKNVLLTVTFKSQNWKTYTQSIIVSGKLSSFSFTVPFKPVFTALNLDEKVSEAIAPDTAIISKAGMVHLTNSRIDIQVTEISDSAFIYVEHNYTASDPIKYNSNKYHLSPNRYWKVSGIFPKEFKASATLYFDGRKSRSTNGDSYLDTALVQNTSDSLVLLYRKNAGYDWKEIPNYTKTNIGPEFGYFTLESLQAGEYVFANGRSASLKKN